MAKLTTYTNPVSGKSGKITDLFGIWENILGVLVLLFVVAMGQNLANQVTRRVPALDTSVQPLTTAVVSDGGFKVQVI